MVAVVLGIAGLMGLTARACADERPAVGAWSFDGDMADRSGHANDAVVVSGAAAFAEGRRGLGLRCGGEAVIVQDTPELRPAPGLRIECWAKVEALGGGWQELVIKDRAYQLRLDPQAEGGTFSFFLNVDGWEPRVSSRKVPELGAWHHLLAGWDGREIWLEVDGDRTAVARAGTPGHSSESLEIGKFRGVLDELRIENPGARQEDVACWRFDGDLRDASGHGMDLAGPVAGFAPAPRGQAVRAGAGRMQVADRPELRIAPGLRIDCAVWFDEIPGEGAHIAIKDGEYQLRVDPAGEGGQFSFFTRLGDWEPRVRSAEKAQPGRWYRLSARWDGWFLTLDVNGDRQRVSRSGLPQPAGNPLQVGGFPGLLDHLRIENPRLPTLQVRAARQEHAILCAGRPEKMSTIIRNLGAAAEDVAVRVEPTPGIRRLGGASYQLGRMQTGGERTIEWAVQADAPCLGEAMIEVTAAGAPPVRARHPLVVFAGEDGLPPSASERPGPGAGAAAVGTSWFIDGAAGDNAHAGTSPDAPWKDFSNINGRALGPGDKLLIRRGSVINQELAVSARGRADRWAEIGTYGDGPRPMIRRNWHIDDRCALVRDPDYLRIRGLVFCHAGKGLVINYSKPGHRGLLIEDCIAHHIEGLYRHNSHGIPEWHECRGAPGDDMHLSVGLGIAGAMGNDIVVRDCDVFQNSSGFFVQGHDVLVERVFCHDNIVHNTSPHPFLVNVRRAVLRDSVFDASGWHASAGTMGIMLGDPQGLIIRNCHFLNQPDSGSHDEGGIDFENSGNGCLVDRCTFENNAGAAIEVLGLKVPQTTNIEIRGSRFIRNNTANKLGPAEIYIWGKVRDPAVCCSSGLIEGNGFVTLPGVEFIVNEAPESTSWTAHGNTGYASVEELERAMPYNRPPVVSAGGDIRTGDGSVVLAGEVTDNGRPAGGRPAVRWELIEGPGRVVFEDAGRASTKATFGKPGDYMLRLVADDGELWRGDWTEVHVLPAGDEVRKAWEFNTNHDKEGWTEENLGTVIRQWPNRDWPTTSHPVKHVAGGFYTVAIEGSREARLLSPDHLGVPMSARDSVVIRFQNHTPAARMRLRFTTEADGAWDDAKSLVFQVEPNDNGPRTYSLDMSRVKTWRGALRQLRLDLADGAPLTGTCRFDYLWIATPGEKR